MRQSMNMHSTDQKEEYILLICLPQIYHFWLWFKSKLDLSSDGKTIRISRRTPFKMQFDLRSDIRTIEEPRRSCWFDTKIIEVSRRHHFVTSSTQKAMHKRSTGMHNNT
jgi:hypothetical protein